MRLTFHQLKVFAAVAKHLSVTKAAREMHMTQPAASNIIKQLQSHYGCRLTEVVGKQLSLTNHGELLLEQCEKLFQLLDDTTVLMADMKTGTIGTLKIAIVTTAKYFVPNLLGQFKAKFPKIDIILTVCNRETVVSRIKDNLDDFVIMSHPPSTLPVTYEPFYHDELTVICAPTYYQQHQHIKQLSELNDAAWLTRELGSGTRYATEKIFRQHHFTPHIVMEIGDNEATKQAVIANIGIALVSKQSVKYELETERLHTLDLQDFPVRHQWYFVKREDRRLSALAQKFYEFGLSCDRNALLQ